MIRKVVKILWIFIALISLVCVFIFFSIAKGWIGYMPPVEDLENPNYKFATEVFSEDGKVLGTYSYSKENRVFVGYNDLSPNIINALIATEGPEIPGYVPDSLLTTTDGEDLVRLVDNIRRAPQVDEICLAMNSCPYT